MLRASVLLAACLAPAVALACGYCVEDKIAATYDHAVAERAFARRHVVVFFHVDGAPAPKSGKALAALATTVPWVDPGSARVSEDALTLSVSFDPNRASLSVLQASLEKRLAPRGLSLMVLRVMDRPGNLNAPTTR